jgi:hypothetical protein
MGILALLKDFEKEKARNTVVREPLCKNNEIERQEA